MNGSGLFFQEHPSKITAGKKAPLIHGFFLFFCDVGGGFHFYRKAMDSSEKPTTSFLPNWQEGGPDRLEEVLKRHLPWIQRYVHRRLGNFHRRKADTGDIVQDAMVQFLRHGPRVLLKNDRQFRALLGRIVENVICDNYDWFTAQRRAVARERPLPPDTILNFDPPVGRVSTPSGIVQKHERIAWVRLALELLEPGLREIIVLRRWENLSFTEIGRRLDLSKATARRRYIDSVNRLIEMVSALQEGRLEAVLPADSAQEPEE